MPFIVTTKQTHGGGAVPFIRSRRAVATLEEAWVAVESAERAADETAYFYRRARLPVGTTVLSADDPGRRGTIVKRGGQQWTTRDRPPYVRWDRRIPSDRVPWEKLLLTNTTLGISESGGTVTLPDGTVIEVMAIDDEEYARAIDAGMNGPAVPGVAETPIRGHWAIRVCQHGHRVEYRENYGGWLHMDALDDVRVCDSAGVVEVVPVPDEAAIEWAEGCVENILRPYSSALSPEILAEQIALAVLRAALDPDARPETRHA